MLMVSGNHMKNMEGYSLRPSSDDDEKTLKTLSTQRLLERYPESERYARRITKLTREAAMAARQSDEYHQLGEMMLDSVERYFPEEYQARRRSLMLRSFAVGAAAGVVAAGYLAQRFQSD